MNNPKVIRFNIGESLDGWIEVPEKVILYIGSKKQNIGNIKVVLNYRCSKKLFRRCFSKYFYLYGEIIENELGEHLSVSISSCRNKEKADSRGGNKLRCTKLEDLAVKIEVGRGSGEDSLEIVYDLEGIFSKSTVDIASYRLKVQFFIGIPRENEPNEPIKLSEPIEIVVEVVRPIKVSSVDITPKADYYVIGDSVKLDVEISSRYRGEVSIVFSKAIKSKEKKLKSRLDIGENRFSLDGYITFDYRAEVYVELPDIGYSESVSIPLKVLDKRVDLGKISIDWEKPVKLGRKAKLRVSGLANLSLLSRTPLKIEASLYGYHVEKEVILDPKSSCELVLETPSFLTKNSSKNRRGELVIKDMVTSRSLTIQLELPDPLPLDLVIKPRTQDLKLSSGAFHTKEFLDVENRDDICIKVSLSDIEPKPSVCSIDINTVVFEPSSRGSIKIGAEPLKIGREVLRFKFSLSVNDIVVDVYEVSLSIEVYKSYRVERSSVVYPSSGHAVKNQRINVKLDVDVLSDVNIKLKLNSRDIELDKDTYDLKPGKNTLDILGRTTDYRDNIKLELSDGIATEEVILPIKVEKPIITINHKPTSLFKGLKRTMVLRVAKRFEVPIKIAIDIDVDRFSRLVGGLKHIEFSMDPHEKEKELSIDILGIDIGKTNIKLKVKSVYLNENGIELDSWSYDYTIDLVVLMPIELQILNKPSVILLPYPTNPIENVLKSIRSGFVIKLSNVSDQTLPKVSTSIYLDTGVPSPTKLTEASIEPGKSLQQNIDIIIPINYKNREIRIKLAITNEGYYLTEQDIIIPIERYLYALVKIPKEKFVKTCIYPRVDDNTFTYVLLPLWEFETACGEPEEQTLKLFNIAKALFNTLRQLENTQEFNDPWSAAASIILKILRQPDANYNIECDFLRKMHDSIGNVHIVPAKLWILTLSKLIPGCIDVKPHSLLINQIDRLGLIYTNNLIISKSLSNTNIYRELFCIIVGRDSNIYKVVRDYARIGNIPSISLLYTLNRGRELPYEEDIANKIYEENKISYLIYIVLTNNPIVNEINVLNKVDSSIKYLEKSNVNMLLTALLLNKIIYNMVKIIKGDQQ